MSSRFLGHYQIERELGAGGMGVVLEATDSRLGRRVAIKLLHETFLGDPERLARFEREARVLASLNHDNVAAIHGLEKAGDIIFLVLEYVPGDTLADRLAKAAMPLKQTLDVCRQLAQGLEAAHAQGIIHRDLKPANIKITPDGKVKVLDFGLAKAMELVRSSEQKAETATMSLEMTEAGVVMGTVPYMSPEQASAKPMDRRTDIWSFGCILFEALTGRRSFSSPSTAELLVAILDHEPDWSLLPANLPENVNRLLRRCLTKDPRNRLHDIGDARLELEDALAGRIAGSPAVAQPKRGWKVVAGVAAALVVGLAVGALWISGSAARRTPPRVTRFSFDLPPGSRISPVYDVHMAFSRDSKELIYPTTVPMPRAMFSRRLDRLDVQPLPSGKGFGNPFFSPDGRWLAMADYTKRELVKVPLSGGAPIPLVPVVFPFGGEWSSDGHLYWTNSMVGGIVRTSEDGGRMESVTDLDVGKKERVHRFVRLLPGGRSIIYTVASGDIDSFDDARIDAFDLNSKKHKTIVNGGTCARYSPSGHVVYARGGSLYAVRIDTRNLQAAGPTVKVLDGVLMSVTTGAAYFDISAAGDLAHFAGPVESGGRTLEWVDRKGNAAPLSLPPRSYLNQRISPDGRQIAFEVEGPNHDFYVHDLERGVTTRMTTDGLSHGPIWSPDGKRIAYRSWREGMMTVYWMPADRSGPAERLVKTVGWQQPVSFSPDGKNMVFDQMEPSARISNMWVLPVAGTGAPRPIATNAFTEASGKFSPDGKWIVYCSTESGKPEIYVQPWPGPGARIQISSEGGMDPVWRRDGKELFYRNGNKMMAVPVSTQPAFRAGRPQMLWEAEYMFSPSASCGIKGPSTTSYDVSLDGEHFLMTKEGGNEAYSTRIVVVLNWAEELKHLVAAAEGNKQ